MQPEIEIFRACHRNFSKEPMHSGANPMGHEPNRHCAVKTGLFACYRTGMGVARAKSIGDPVRKLSLEDIPPTAKLVMVVGPTGSGKSTILRNLKSAGHVTLRHDPFGVELHGGHRPRYFHGDDPDAAHFIGEMFLAAERAAVDSNQTAQEIINTNFKPLATVFERIFPSFTIRAVRTQPNSNNIRL